MRPSEWLLGIVVALAVFVLLAGAMDVAPEVSGLVAAMAGMAASYRPGTPDAVRVRAEYRRRRR